MITQLRFKNWRSLKDVTIDDLQPITVFIGANSSGKTNILDALYFLRQAVSQGVDDAFNTRNWQDEVRTLDVDYHESMELEFEFISNRERDKLKYKFFEYFSESTRSYQSGELLTDINQYKWLKSEGGNAKVVNQSGEEKEEKDLLELALSAFGRTNDYPQIYKTFQFITQRWQMLDENFMPPLFLSTGLSSDSHIIDRCADNLPLLLAYMQRQSKELYNKLISDLSWLMNHARTLNTQQTERITRMYILETRLAQSNSQEAPTVSAGTRRLITMLAAYYALDMRLAHMPGLVVIEEPDTALNPGLIKRFVEQIRVYAEGENPRQFIFTTHNPSFLNYFKPEEVRVVERDENGYTTVNKIPAYIEEIWLKNGEYGLGEVWTTRSFGGVPE